MTPEQIKPPPAQKAAKSMGTTVAYSIRVIGHEHPISAWTSDLDAARECLFSNKYEVVKITVEPIN